MKSWIMAAAAAAAGATGTPAVAMQNPGADGAARGDHCELHVWGAGRPNFKPRASLMLKVDPAQLDTSNPLSNVNLFSTVKRAGALSDDVARKLLPRAASITIVRHDEMIDTDKTPLKGLNGRLTASSADCYADLIIGNLYAIFPNPNASYENPSLLRPLVEMALAGSDRLVIEFWLRDFSGRSAEVKVYKRKNDTPLPHVPFMTEQMRRALELSANANLNGFAAYVAEQRRR